MTAYRRWRGIQKKDEKLSKIEAFLGARAQKT